MSASCLLWSVVAVVAWGICPVLERIGLLRISPPVMMFFHALIVAFALGVYCLMRAKTSGDISLQMDWTTVAILVAVALVGGLIGEYAYFQAITSSQASQAVAITSAYPLVTIVVSVFALGEQLTLSTGLGTLLIIGGVGLLSSGVS